MATNALPNVPYKAPIADQNGLVAQVWQAFFRELFNRVGQNIAPSNTDLANLVIEETEGVVADIVVLQSQMATTIARVSNLEGGITMGRQL